jgi:tRNA A-37 threonylcarbamoyl transferase component Bud32
MVPEGPSPGNVPALHSAALTSGRARAQVAAVIAEPLRELLAHDVAAWSQRGLELCKERTVRSVLRGRLAGVDVHVKVFRADTLADRARDAVRRGRGEREAANLSRAGALGLPVVEALGSGVATDAGELRSFVVTRTVAGAAPFTFALPAAVQQRVGALLRRVHDLGLDLADLHPGNLVVDADGQPWLLDLTSVRHAGTLSLRRRAAGLALFCQQLDGGALDATARDLLAGYRDAGAELPAGLGRELTLATHRWRAHALGAFGRRSTRSCRHTEVQSRRRGQPRWFWHRLGDGEAMRRACLAFGGAEPEPLRRGRRGAVWLTDDLAVKQRDRGAARTLWRAAYWLLFARVATATPVALCLEVGRGLVFTRRLPGPTLAAELTAGGVDIPHTAESIGRNVGRLHAHGLRNRDLKFDNLIRDPGTGEVCMVDLDGVRRSNCDDTRGLGADLGRLLAAFRGAGSPGGTATVRTFLGAYLRAHRTLLRRPLWARIRRQAELRAGEWASAHRGD